MATITQGVMGGFTGRVGTVVGYQWRGKWCMRARPPFIRNPRTEAQQAHRMMFREEVRLASRLNWLLRESLAQLSLDEGLTPCNYFIRENRRCFGWTEGRLTVDWANLVLSHGPVAPVAFGVPEVSEGTRLTVAFEKNPTHTRADAHDKVYLFLYCESEGKCFLTAPVYRNERSISVVLPVWWAGRELQLWGLVEDRQGRWSETIYIGYGPLDDTPATDGDAAGLPEMAVATVPDDLPELVSESDVGVTLSSDEDPVPVPSSQGYAPL